MRGNVEFSSGRCAHCNELRKLERPSQVWGAGDLIMVLFTFGLWAVVKLMARPAWHCSTCGSKVA